MKRKNQIACSMLALLSALALSSCGSVAMPYIGENGNWWANGSDLGIPATGPKGDSGEPGQDGESVAVVSVTKIKTEGNVDTYQIVFSDGTSAEFTVTNGTSVTVVNVVLESSVNGVNTYRIYFSDGFSATFQVKDGKSITVSKIEKTKTQGLIDTYRVTMSDGSYFEFVVKNGTTPYIGDNGNWWIDGEDTGVLADPSKADDRGITDEADGLIYEVRSIYGASGFVVTGFEPIVEKDYYDIMIPNYIGSVPVIGIDKGISFYHARSISLSKNIVFLGESCFSGTSNLVSFDFNGCNIKEIPAFCFSETGLSEISIPPSVEKIGQKAFWNCKLKLENYANVKYFGDYCFCYEKDSYLYSVLSNDFVYLKSDVEYVGVKSFSKCRVCCESVSRPSSWASDINGIESGSDYNKNSVSFGCASNGEYIYSSCAGGVSLLSYLGTAKTITVPEYINGKKVVRAGWGFFSCPYQIENDDDAVIEWVAQKGYEKIVLPSSLNYLEYYSFFISGAMIISKASSITFSSHCGSTRNYCEKSYFFFECQKENAHIFDYEDQGEYYDEEDMEEIEQYCRFSFGFDSAKLVFDKTAKCYYYDNGSTYSLFAYMRGCGESLTTSTSYLGKTVKTIERNAISFLSEVKCVSIGSGYDRVRSFAISCLPNCIAIAFGPIDAVVNAYAVNVKCDVYVPSKTKPGDWDSNWAPESEIHYGYNVSGLAYENNICAVYENGSWTALKYCGDMQEVTVPAVFKGGRVTKIVTGFYKSKTVAETSIYIPSSVAVVENSAFYVHNSYNCYAHVYCGFASAPSGWESGWISLSGSSSYSTVNWISGYNDLQFGSSFAYRNINGTATLIRNCKHVGQTPRTVSNLTVTAIATGYCEQYISDIYIPDTIKLISEKAFVNPAYSTMTFNFEAATKDGVNNNYYYNSRYSSYSEYKRELFSQILPY